MLSEVAYGVSADTEAIVFVPKMTIAPVSCRAVIVSGSLGKEFPAEARSVQKKTGLELTEA